jgi:hypothetical protein
VVKKMVKKILRIAGKRLQVNISVGPKISRLNFSYNGIWKIFWTPDFMSTTEMCSLQTPCDAVTINAGSWPTRIKDPNAKNFQKWPRKFWRKNYDPLKHL